MRVVRGDQVDVPVAVHVRRRHRSQEAPHLVVHAGGERAVAQVPQHGDGARIVVRRDQVDVPVAVHIRRRHGRRTIPYLIVHAVRKPAIPQVPQHGDGARTVVRRDQVDVSVAVHVRHRHRLRVPSHLKRPSGKVEPAFAAEQQARLQRFQPRDQGERVTFPASMVAHVQTSLYCHPFISSRPAAIFPGSRPSSLSPSRRKGEVGRHQYEKK